MSKKDLAKFIIGFLGIKEDIYIINEVIEDLGQIEDSMAFKTYIKDRFGYEKYKYLNGLAKFVALKNDFLKYNKPKLTAEQDFKVRCYADKLFSRVEKVFDEIDYRTKIGVDIQDKRVNFWIYQEFGEDEKALNVLNKIGKRAVILDKLRKDRQGLKEEIVNIVNSLTMKKLYPQIENKKTNVLEILRGRG